MSNYFKLQTVEQIISESKSLSDILINHENYYAHTPDEKLYEHTKLTNEYLTLLINANGLDLVLDKLLFKLLYTKKQINLNYAKKLFVDSIIFHDFGKVNVNFQIGRMKNFMFEPNSDSIGYKHSMLSSYIYIAYHFDEIQKLSINANGKKQLFGLSTVFPYCINQHHQKKLNKIHDIARIEKNVEEFLKYISCFNFNLNFYFAKDIFSKLSILIKDFDFQDSFSLWCLAKLNYSLLTASDYYATHHYMSNLKKPYHEFGIINEDLRKRIFENFKIKKSYNEDLLSKKEYYRNYNFEDLCKPDNDNLNILRQKLGVEVIDGIETNPNGKVFYIEAPTGGGKTNLSVVAIYQLLKQHKEINKVFYVFPFTTLITQTFKTLKETLGLTNSEIIQIHSKAGFHSKYNNEEDDPDFYSNKKKNYIDNLFINYQFCLLSHIRFFDILKTNRKETNYILHRLANSIIVIDELQSYSPSVWDKVKYFISNYAEYFNVKFIIMSATLPKIHSIAVGKDIQFQHLIKDAQKNYLTNPNFKDRVCFDYTLLDNKYKNISEAKLSDFIYKHSEQYAISNKIYKNSVHTIVEFIFKKSAASFFNSININGLFKDYEIFVLSGTIIEPRRKYIINYLKNRENREKKILLITTQVVEAGIDIDMDLGFKNQSLLDSDEQLAGRINRNVLKGRSKLFLFNKDEASRIYGNDLRYEFTKKMDLSTKMEISENKDFNKLYDLVKEKINADNKKELTENFSDYKSKIDNLNFYEIDEDFQLIDNETTSFFVPLSIPIKLKEFENEPNFIVDEVNFLINNGCINKNDTEIDGEKVWKFYKSIVENRNKDFVQQAINIKIINGIMSKFIFSTFSNKNLIEKMKRYCDYDEDKSNFKIYGYYYLNRHEGIYTLEGGLDESKLDSDFII